MGGFKYGVLRGAAPRARQGSPLRAVLKHPHLLILRAAFRGATSYTPRKEVAGNIFCGLLKTCRKVVAKNGRYSGD